MVDVFHRLGVDAVQDMELLEHLAIGIEFFQHLAHGDVVGVLVGGIGGLCQLVLFSLHEHLYLAQVGMPVSCLSRVAV